MSEFKPPSSFSFSDNVADGWSTFKRQFMIYLIASDLEIVSDRRKVNILLNLLGPEGQIVFNNFNLTDKGRENFNEVILSFDQFFLPKKNIVFERFKFISRKQMGGEPFDQFITDIMKLCKSCEFNQMEDEMLLLVLVVGIADKSVQEKLLTVDKLTFKKACEYIRVVEQGKLQASNMQHVPVVQVDKVVKQSTSDVKQSNSASRKQCSRCGFHHRFNECLAFNKTCYKCKGKHHFANMCRGNNVNKNYHKVDVVDDPNCLVLDSVAKVDSNTSDIKQQKIKEWTQEIEVEGKLITFKLDSGSEVNIIPLNKVNSIVDLNNLKRCNLTLMSYGNHIFKPIGSVTLKCSIPGSNICTNQEFCVIDFEARPLLGLMSCVQLDLIKRVDSVWSSKEIFIKNNHDVFNGFGCMPGQYNIKVDQNIKPVICPPRRIPLSIQPKLKQTLDVLEKNNIISKIDKPTGWLSNLVIVEKKNGSLRLCLDPRNLNRAIQREHFQIPSADDMIGSMSNKCIFSVVDMKDGFYHIQLDEESSDLCSFGTPFARYKFLRMPNGLSCAPEVFQRKNTEIFSDISGVCLYFDDLIIAAENEEQHDKIFQKVINRAREYDIKFNPDKLKYKLSEVRYLGHIFSKSGLKLDPERVQAISDMPVPKSKEEIQRFLGMTAFISRFVPNYSSETFVLRCLLKKSVEWKWDEMHDKAFEKIKHLLISAPILQFYNPKLNVVLQCDSSQYGLGAVLLQNGLPVSYASRSLTDTEQKYAQIEKELLAIVFAAQKFHHFIYGQKILVHSDHKPLVSIVNFKPVSQVTARIQRMLLRLLSYNITVEYVPGKLLYFADTLSRAPVGISNTDIELDAAVHSVSKHMALSERRREQFATQTDLDPSLVILKNYCIKGWPSVYSKVDPLCKVYWKLKNDISYCEGLLFHNERLIVPVSLRSEMLNIVHEGHQGVSKSKSLARSLLFWPAMGSQIEEKVLKCQVCQKYYKKNASEPLMPHPIPDRQWQKVAADILEFRCNNFLVVKDYYSKWIDCYKLHNKSASEVIRCFKLMFSVHGIPEIVVTDNVPFNSFEFLNFSKEFDFNMIFSSPTFAQSNGMAESGVKTCKFLMKKAFDDNSDFSLLLMEYRNTPITGMEYSPAQLLFNRRLRTRLPVTQSLLQSKVCTDVHKSLEFNQFKQKKCFDKTTIPLKPLNVNDRVLMYKDNNWVEGFVIKIDNNPRSYIVKIGDVEYRRNRKHLVLIRGNETDKIDKPTVYVKAPENGNFSNERIRRVVRPPPRFKDYV